MPERDNDGRVFNTAYVFDRYGKQIAKHRKVHLFDINVNDGQCFEESETLAAGDTVTTFDTEFGVFGLCVCYDFRFPELGRLMAIRGAQAVLVPAAFNMTTGPVHWELAFRAQALFNQFLRSVLLLHGIYLHLIHSWGHSIVTDPWGQVIHQMDEKAGIQITKIDLTRTKEIREQLPLLKHRRTDVYNTCEERD